MSLVGQIEPFNVENGDFPSYLECFEQLCVRNDVPTDRKVALFITLMAGEMYQVLKNLLVDPAAPSSKTYDELVAQLSTHFSPKRIVIAERFKFFKAVQEVGESVASFVVRLRNLSRICEFGAFLENARRDRFVCGLYSSSLQKKLLSEDKLS